MARLDQRVTGVAEKQALIYTDDAGFVEEMQRTLDYLESIPTRFDFRLNAELQPDRLGSNPNEVFLQLLRNLHGWLGFIVFSSAYKLRHLTCDILDGLNSCNYMRVSTAARSVMEHVATLNYYYIKVSPRLDSLNSIDARHHFPDYIMSIVQIMNELLAYARSTRFNWASYVSGDLDTFFASWNKVDDSLKQVSILTPIDKLPQEGRGARFYYEMLCDFVHPNIASHTLVVNEARQIENQQMLYSLAYSPDSDELLAIMLHAISIPVRSCLRLFRGELASLRHSMKDIDRRITGIEKLL